MHDQAPTERFRTRPPAPVAHALRRPRLLAPLRERFDRELTVVVGGAGYGKTTLLAQAVEENRFDPLGDDLWLLCDERDRAPSHLLRGLSSTLTGADDQVDRVEDLVDLLVLRAPTPLALVIDDAHLLDDSPSADLLAVLLDRLPGHVHLVVGSRTMPRLGVRRRQARGTAVVIDERDLGFTPDELAALADTIGVASTDDLPPWPALAVLQGSVGHLAGIDFVWEEILEGLAPDRRRALALVSRIGRVDDEVLRVVAGDDWTASALFEGLPLVDVAGREHRLHDLWRDALVGEVAPADAAPALTAAGRLLEARGDVLDAARCYREAGAIDDLQRLVRAFASRPISGGLDRSTAAALADLLPADLRDAPLGWCLRAIVRWNAVEHEACMRDLEAVAAAHGDDELRALAWWRLVQRAGDVDPAALTVPPELAELASDGWPMAINAVALVESHQAQQRGDLAGALAPLDTIVGADPRTRRAAVGGRLVALGQPELVQITLADVLAEGVTEAVGAQAVWLRGEMRPADAWPIAATLPSVYGRRRLPDVQVPLLGIVASVALAAGALRDARELADDAMRTAAQTVPRVAAYAQVADALVTLQERGDEAAAARLAAIVADLPLRPWPPWAYLAALAPIRALLDDTEWLDDLGFGPSIQVALDAGRLVRALREGAPAASAAALPWPDRTLLEVQVPPSMLCELAVAASASTPAAAAVLDDLPLVARSLARLLEHPNAEVRGLAAAHVGRAPIRPPYDLRIRLLGDVAVERSDGRELGRLDGRARPRALLAVLALEGSVPRPELAARLWPDLAPDAAANNLRVTLHKLIGAVDPDRGGGGSWWIRADAERISLTGDGLTTDLEEFDRHLDAARRAEQLGALSAADEHYDAMRACYGGELLPGIDDPTVEPERTRVRALAYGAACRQAELQLARGEPEMALRHAVDAERLDELGERAHRIMILAHLALGARSAALDTAERLQSRLAANGLTPEPDTAALLRRVGVATTR